MLYHSPRTPGRRSGGGGLSRILGCVIGVALILALAAGALALLGLTVRGLASAWGWI